MHTIKDFDHNIQVFNHSLLRWSYYSLLLYRSKAHVFNGLVPGKVYSVSVIVVASSGGTSNAVNRNLQTSKSSDLYLHNF